MKRILQDIGKFLSNRTFLIFMVILSLFSGVFAGLYNIQILNAEQFKEHQYDNTYAEQVLEGTRGNIYDRYGRLLAGNEEQYSLFFSIKTSVEDLNGAIHYLFKILYTNEERISIEQALPIAYDEEKGFYYLPTYSIEYSEIRFYNFLAEIYGTSRAYLTDEQKETTAEEAYIQMREKTFNLSKEYSLEEAMDILWLRYALFVARAEGKTEIQIATDITEKTRAEIIERSTDFPGFTIQTEYTRVYPQGELFSHILGYVGRINSSELETLKAQGYEETDMIGKTGLEKVYESMLRGTDGVLQIEYDGRTGSRVDEEVLIQAVQGNSIYLTIDIEIQKMAEVNLYNQIKSLLLKKITGVSSENGKSYSVNDIFCAILDNNFLPVDLIEKSDLESAQKVKSTYDSYVERNLEHLKTQITSSNTTLAHYSETLMDIYNVMVENMRSGGRLSYDYQKDTSFYQDYSAGRKTAREFFEYCVQKGYLDLAVYHLSQETNIDVIINNILSYEFRVMEDSRSFKKLTYQALVTDQAISQKDFLRLLYDLELLSSEDGSLDAVNSGHLSILECIKKKIEADEITPADLNLDPCSGSVVMTDPDSGEVLAMVSYPSYDANLINNVSYYSQLVNDQSSPLVFRALTELRAPGSTFKMCSSIAALETGYITQNTRIYDHYAFQNVNSVGKPVCWSTTSHGLINVIEALKHSCNYFFYEVGYRLSDPVNGRFADSVGLEKLAYFAEQLGLSTKTGIEIDEAVPHASENDAVRSAIGQGSNAFSTANLNRYTCTIANGGTVYDLFLIDRIQAADGMIVQETKPEVSHQTDIATSTFNIVQQGMREMVLGNGVLRTLEQHGITAAGKTGTAQEFNDRPDHSLFTGYTNIANPDICITIVIPFGGGSANATPVFRDIVLDYYGFTS